MLKKSIRLIYKQRNNINLIYKQWHLLHYYVKKNRLKKKNPLLFTVHSHQLFLISINQKHGIYFLLSLTKIV